MSNSSPTEQVCSSLAGMSKAGIRLYFLFFSASVKQTKSQETIPHILSAFFTENSCQKYQNFEFLVPSCRSVVYSCPYQHVWSFAQPQEHISTHFLQFFLLNENELSKNKTFEVVKRYFM